MFSFFTQPTFPKTALGIEREMVTAVSLSRSGRQFGISRAASVEVPNGLIEPNFLDRNISDPTQFRYILEEAVTSAGLLGQKRWSVSLPSTTARTAILSLDGVAGSKGESEEIFDWKAEQTFGAPAAELRITRVPISSDVDGKRRFFATAIKLSVLNEYETIFEQFGWKAGLILPRSVAEARWLFGGGASGDSLLISTQWDGFTAIMMQGDEPFVVRSVTCRESELDDEIYRLLLFYNDRFGRVESGRLLDRVLLVGRDLSTARISEISKDALGRSLNVLRAEDIGLDIPAGELSFGDLAAPAGLAALGSR